MQNRLSIVRATTRPADAVAASAAPIMTQSNQRIPILYGSRDETEALREKV
jgi:hypothetical protein